MVVSFRLTKLEMIIIINVYILYCRLQSIRTEEKPAEHGRIDCAARRSGRKKGLANERHQPASKQQMLMANDDDVFTRRNYYYDRGNVNSSSKTTNCIEIFEREGMKRGRTRRRRREQDFELKININLCVLTLCKHDERASSELATDQVQQLNGGNAL